MIMREIEGLEGFRNGGKVVNNLRYVDVTVILAKSAQQLQQLINTVVTESELNELYLNNTKILYYGIFESKSCIYSWKCTGTSTIICIPRESIHHVPPINKTCANSFFDRSFVYAAPTLWNALDLDIRLLPFDAFKKSVKTHRTEQVLIELDISALNKFLLNWILAL